MPTRKPRVLVIGDVMLDVCTDVRSKHANPEGAALVTTGSENDRTLTLGGAGLVAALLRGLGASVKLMGRAGQDIAGESVHLLLHEFGISCKSLVFNKNLVTPTKIRYANEHGVIVYRHDEESSFEEYLVDNSSHFNFDVFSELVSKADCVVIADYGKGYCQKYGLQIINAARYYNVLTVVQAKPALLHNYAGADIIKVNSQEAQNYLLATSSDPGTDIGARARALATKLDTEVAIVTAGKGGCTYAVANKDGGQTTYQAPARPCFPHYVNCVGAGDAFLAGLTMDLLRKPAVRSNGFDGKGLDPVRLDQAMASASAVAAEYLGAGYPAVHPATAFLASHNRAVQLNPASKFKTLREAAALSEAWRSIDETVVFTNGCFDLLHRGHLSLLQQAKQQGTKLIVAVNSDMSVRLLKGPKRPIQDIATRAQLLANLSCVDAVVALDEEDFTNFPALRGMITTLAPDVLVKGAQYEEQDIVGWEEMVKRDPPGRVWRCPMVDNCSTTNTLARIQDSGSNTEV